MLADNFSLFGKSADIAIAVAQAVIRDELSDRKLRKEDYQKNIDMYRNTHEVYFKRRLDEDDELFKYRKSNAVKSNLCGFTVDLSAKYLYGKASKIIRKFSEDEKTQNKLLEIFEDTELDSFLLNAAKQTSVFSEEVVRLVPVDKETGLQVEGKSTETSIPYPVLLDPRYTFVSRNRYGRIQAVVVLYSQLDYVTNKINHIMELIVDDSRWMWKGESSFLPGNSQLSAINPYSIQAAVVTPGIANPYRLIDEFVQFVNNDEKKSDLVDIIDLNIALDESLTDKQHFFQKHGWPQLVSEVNLEQVANSPNKIWEIASDGMDSRKVLDRMGFLTWDGKMTDHANFVKNLERNILILSSTAAISTGDLEAIGQLRSGAALITAHSVAIHKTEAKQIVWARNEKQLYKAIMCFDAYLHNENVDTRYPNVKIQIRFPRDFVPGAEMERTQIQQIEANSHFKPIRDILQENYGNLSKEAIEAKYQEIIKDSEDIVDSTRKFESVQEGGGSVPNTTSRQKSQEQKKPAS